MDIDRLEVIDKIKSKILKYIMFKKRTEKEVRQKFAEVDEDVLESIIDDLKENRVYK